MSTSKVLPLNYKDKNGLGRVIETYQMENQTFQEDHVISPGASTLRQSNISPQPMFMITNQLNRTSSLFISGKGSNRGITQMKDETVLG